MDWGTGVIKGISDKKALILILKLWRVKQKFILVLLLIYMKI